MSDKKESVAPITRPPSFTTPGLSSGPRDRDLKLGKKQTSKRQRRKKAARTQRGALNVRRVFGGVFILILLVSGFYIFTNPNFIPSVMSGEIIERTETCTVERVNTTLFFETSCGRFIWNAEALQGGSPAGNLTEGTAYQFTSTGITIPVASIYPEVIKVEPVS